MIKNTMVMDGSTEPKIYVTNFGTAAEIERDFIKQGRREGPTRCKLNGIVLDRPCGAAKLGLEDHAKKIDEYQALKLNKRVIAKLLGVSFNMLYSWLRRQGTVNAGEVTDSGLAHPATNWLSGQLPVGPDDCLARVPSCWLTSLWKTKFHRRLSMAQFTVS